MIKILYSEEVPLMIPIKTKEVTKAHTEKTSETTMTASAHLNNSRVRTLSVIELLMVSFCVFQTIKPAAV